MRVFWIILTLIIAGSGAVVFMPTLSVTRPPSQPTSNQTSPATSTPADTNTTTSIPEDIEAPAPVDIETGSAEVESDTTPDNSEELAETLPDADATEVFTEDKQDDLEAVAADDTEITADSIIANLDSMMDAIEYLPSDETESEIQTNESAENGWKMLAAQTQNAGEGDPITSTSPGNADGQNAPYGSGSEVTTPNVKAPVEISPATLAVTQNDDGSMTIGDTYTITGNGTKQSPYVMSWKFLVSLREFYNPREGKKAIPEHFAMFNGKYITIPGYLQFPLATPEPVECLVMLNQWDGCCIGVPPTPYDAIEVSLSEPASREQKFAVEGRIVGKLKIDPYLVGNWLIGLYLLTDASVDVSGARSVEEVFGNPLPQFDPTTE